MQLIFAVLPACCPVISFGVNSAFSVELCACKNCCICSFKMTRFVDFMDRLDCCVIAFYLTLAVELYQVNPVFFGQQKYVT